MKKSNSTKKAQSAFKKLGAVALMVATMFFVACNQTGGGNSGTGGGGKPKPTPKPKHAITFSVDSTTPNGTLKVEGDGITQPATSPINVEEGKTITFTAKANDGYKVKEWKVDSTVVANNKTTTYTHTVKKPATITVSFESNSTPPTKYTVTLTQTANGKVTASPAIPTDKQVAKDTEITFTATANEGYRVNTWTVSPSSAIQSGGGKGEATATLKITADTAVSVSFEEIPKHAITFSVEGANGTLTAKVDGGEIASGKEVEEGKTVTFTAKANDGYRVKEWKVDGNVVEVDKLNTYNHFVRTAVTVTISFELMSNAPFVEGGAVLILSPDHLTIEVKAKTEDGSDIAVEGCNETTLKSNVKTKLNATGTRVVLKGKITELYCPSNKLTELNVQGLTALQDFICSYNQLTTLDVQGLTTLKVLICHENQLTSLGVQGCTALQKLACYDNKLIELNVQGLTALQSLNCCSNKLTELNVQGCTALQKLECNRNQLTALNVQGLTALQWLYCYHNQLTALNVQSLTSLQELYCSNNQLTTLGVQGCTSLQELKCYNNQLTALNVQGLTALQWLYCSNNQLTALNVQGCSVLKKLVCLKNNLNAQAMTELLKALPARESGDNAFAYLYTEKTGESEGNHKDFTQPTELKDALDGAKSRNWKLEKRNANGNTEDI